MATKKSKPINQKIVQEILSQVKFKPSDHETLQIFDNTMSADTLMALASAAGVDASQTLKNGNKSDAKGHIVKQMRLLLLAVYHLEEELTAQAEAE